MEKAAIRLPELLAPAGSPKALDAAIDSGADAVYFGATAFNARIGAENFSSEALSDAIAKCRAYGVKAYVTLNTLVLDREMSEFLKTAEQLLALGANAFIIADIGAASALRRYLPDAELHASTQMSCHSADHARELAEMGFKRAVLARETSLKNIKYFTENSPIEAEIFIHGALCVSHSGQCLFSSVVGGRSGNRGECAQPCRLPYCGSDKYPLSLRDLCLAEHIPAIIESGVASLKIEGRMKSPEYVHEVTRIYRLLLDERRDASRDELAYLASVFSRGGFTDGYFTGNIGKGMMGIRSDRDKDVSRSIPKFDRIERKLPLSIKAELCADTPALLTVSDGKRTASVSGDAPFSAINAPMTEESVLGCLSKLGGTPYYIEKHEINISGSIMLPVSRLNDLRRRALSALTASPEGKEKINMDYALPQRAECREERYTARFTDASQITEKAKELFSRTYLPLHKYSEKANGVLLPPVIFDSEKERVRAMLEDAVRKGAKYALVGNLGHLALSRELGLIPTADLRLNVFNRECAQKLTELGFESFILSPELTLPQIRDIGGMGEVIVCGRLPLMLLEKCAIKEFSSCDKCEKGRAELKDRKGISFPVVREYEHRNTIYNSLPTYMGDKKQSLSRFGVKMKHFIFTGDAEETDRMITAFLRGEPLSAAVRRIKE